MYVDLTKFNPKYYGGVRRFCVDLIIEISNNKPLKILIFDENLSEIEKIFSGKNNIKIINIKKSYFIEYFLSFFAIFCSMIKSDKFYATISSLLKPFPIRNCENIVCYTPNSVINYYNNNIINIVSIHDLQHEIIPKNFDYLTRLYRWSRYRATLRYANIVQVSSITMQEEIQKLTNLKTIKFKHIPEFVDENFVNQIIRSRSCRDDNSEDKITVFYPAQLWPHKGHLDILKDLDEVSKNLNIPIDVNFCGQIFDRDIHKEITNFTSSKLNITHHGLVPDKKLLDLYSLANIVIIPSYYESSSLPLIEACMSKIPVIARDIPVFRELSLNLQISLYKTNKDLEICFNKISTLKTKISNKNDKFLLENVAKIYTSGFKDLK